MTLVVHYPTKKACKDAVGQELKYTETSLFGPEYKYNGILTVANRPHITRSGKEWFGNVIMKDGKIAKVT